MPNCLYNIYEWQLPGFLWRIIYWSNCLGLLCAFKTERNRFNCYNWFLLVWFFSDIWPFPEEALWVEGWEGEKHRQFYVEWKVDTCRVNWKKERCLDFSNWPYLFSANDQLKAVFAEAKEGNIRLIVVDIQQGMLLVGVGGRVTDVPTVSVKMVGTLWSLLVPSMLVYKIWWPNRDKQLWEGWGEHEKGKNSVWLKCPNFFCLRL